VPDAEHHAAEGLALQAARVDDRPDVGNGREVEDAEVPRLDVDFHLGEPDHEGPRLAVSRIRVASGGDEALSGERRHRRLRVVVHVLGWLVAIPLAAELDGLLRRLGERHAAPAA
jgi:hypothetical protein